MSTKLNGEQGAAEQVGAVQDDPTMRIELVTKIYYGSFDQIPRSLPYSRAALSFICWQLARGSLAPLDG
jgi:hypothetical protein